MSTDFITRDGAMLMGSLCGMPLSRSWGNEPPYAGELAHTRVDGKACELMQEEVSEDGLATSIRFRVGGTGLRLETVWRKDPGSGVVSRRDRLLNAGEQPHVLNALLARFTFGKGHYECYAQASTWCAENQGCWQDLHTGITLTHSPGCTTQGATPYLAVRRRDTHEGLIFHVLPKGNWIIRAASVPSMERPRFAVIELGLSDNDLHRTIAPGETFDLPELLVQSLPEEGPHLAAPALHRYLLAHHLAGAKPEAPVVYNTWFDLFEIIDVPRLRRQLAVAREVGCEVFVIDAGWFGAGEGNWSTQIGDWREKTNAAFAGRMEDFAAEVRAAGLGFGLWMEPERFGPGAPVCAEHPEWFRQGAGFRRIDLTQVPARAWVRAEIGRLVETYSLAWMKVDFNFSLGPDESGGEFADYYREWYTLLDEVRNAYPQTFFEGCASGGMRLDIESLSHFDGQFLSDTVNPIEVLRISQGAWLRLPPGRIFRWTVLRNAGKVAPQYGRSMESAEPILLASGGAVWQPIGVDMDFSLLAAMPGMFGLSGDLESLTGGQRARMAEGVAFFKRWRRLIARSVAYQLTPPEPISSREGWFGVQLQDTASDTSLVFALSMGNAGTPPVMRLRGLDPKALYTIRAGFEESTCASLKGDELMTAGIHRLLLDASSQSSILLVEKNNVLET